MHSFLLTYSLYSTNSTSSSKPQQPYGKNHRSVGIVFFMRCTQSSSLP